MYFLDKSRLDTLCVPNCLGINQLKTFIPALVTSINDTRKTAKIEHKLSTPARITVLTHSSRNLEFSC
jgi:hypothetical protein